MKRQLRQQMAQLRREKHATLQESLQQTLQAVLPTLLPPPPLIVSGYIAIKDEANITPCLHTLHQLGYTLCLPVVIAPKTPLIFRQWTPSTQLTTGNYRIPVPPESSPQLLPNVILTPLLAFDKEGYRLGYGGGFYDRTLAQFQQEQPVLSVGIGFSFQEVASLPTEPTDIKLDRVITERGTRNVPSPDKTSLDL